MDIAAIIPARGGSKSIPKKNIISFLGKPLIYWSIVAAIKSKMINRVIVSTDDNHIAEIAGNFGAEIPFIRPKHLGGDLVLDYPVIRHCVDYLSESEGYRPDIVVQLRPTSPLRPDGLIDKGISKLISTPVADSLRVVCEAINNPYKMWQFDGDFIVPLIMSNCDEQYNQPRQLLPVTYWQIGTLDVIRTTTIIQQSSLTGKHILPMIVESSLAVDIDDHMSLKRAEEVCTACQFGE